MNLLLGHHHEEECVGVSALPVISIMGPMGIGKTSLVQLVYNDNAVKDYFQLRMWVYVGDGFVVKKLFAIVLEQILREACRFESMNEMANWVHRKLGEKRFLLVLDDFSDDDGNVDDKWSDFTLPLRRAAAVGSKIIISTRSQSVASIVRSTYVYTLKPLSEEDCWSMFDRTVFGRGGQRETDKLEEIGRQIVKKCQGIPLQVKILGGLMRYFRTEFEWMRVLNSEIRDFLPETYDALFGGNFNNLAPQLKNCLSYCSIFPEDYEIEKNMLIQLWMAQGFLEASNGDKSMEDVGNEYFNHLFPMSFQDAKRNEFGDIIICKMNSYGRNHARYIARSKCQIVEVGDQMPRQDLFECQHLSLISNGERLTLPVSPLKLKKLRTLCLLKAVGLSGRPVVPPKAAFSSKSLRVLDLSGASITGFSFSANNLKHLKYLDLSQTNIEVLPKCITQLYNLQTLKLEKCESLRELPKHLANLIKLRHLHIDSAGKWVEMPQNMDRLRFLQTLPIFKLSKEDPERSIRELKCLKSLRGRLEILCLENASSNLSTAIAFLKGLDNVHTLSLQWNDKMENWDSEICDQERLDNIVALSEMLQPHSNLKILNILNFPGAAFPTWVTSGFVLSSLVEMNLQGCCKLKHIQSFRQLPNLKVLNVCEMSNLKRIGGSRFDGNDNIVDIAGKQEATIDVGAETYYPQLKQLTLNEIPNLEEWLEDAGLTFNCLEQLTLQRCPKLRKMPLLLPSLKELSIEEVGGMGVLSIADWPRLQKFLSENNNSLMEFRSLITESVQNSWMED
ncbi:hypothetical protein Sjap_008639 [Stephania japonica]|uniref:NB-ARC domain-containing protein n=1 Tax=Stephania japonica TaxID=461633 RepID=A0AAP0JS65_9MAGN